MYYGIGFAYVTEKFVAQSFAFRGPFHQAGNVDYLYGGGYHLLGVVYFGELYETFIGYRDNPYIGLDGAEREIGRLRFSVGQTVEKGRLAYVGQAYYPAL